MRCDPWPGLVGRVGGCQYPGVIATLNRLVKHIQLLSELLVNAECRIKGRSQGGSRDTTWCVLGNSLICILLDVMSHIRIGGHTTLCPYCELVDGVGEINSGGPDGSPLFIGL